MWLSLAASLNAQNLPQRLPRETKIATAAVQGIVRNRAGYGLGGVNVSLSEASRARGLTIQTTGDGVYRLLDLPPGTYDIRIQSEGFEPFNRAGIHLEAGDLAIVSADLNPLQAAPENAPGIVRQPGMGPLPALAPQGDVESAPYRLLPQASTAELTGGAGLAQPLSPDDAVFTAVPNRWGLDYPAYKRYDASGEYPIVVGHLYNPFNRNKLKGDYPIFGNQTFLKPIFDSALMKVTHSSGVTFLKNA